jgi:putative transposase
LKNVTVGNEEHQEVYNLSDVVTIKKRYKKKISHFNRNDRRIKKKIYEKYGKRSKNRTKQIMHTVSK